MIKLLCYGIVWPAKPQHTSRHRGGVGQHRLGPCTGTDGVVPVLQPQDSLKQSRPVLMNYVGNSGT